MERYRFLIEVGNGAYSKVYKAVNRETQEVVAIKEIKRKVQSWEEVVKLREIVSLRKLSHKNIVKLKEIIRVKDVLYLVYEFMDQNLLQFMRDRTQFLQESEIRSYIHQILSGLAYCHRNGITHRDIKPENILIQHSLCKLADFSQSRHIRSRPPFTDYISTRWYRAPEILLRSKVYNQQADIFSLACLIIELYNLQPFCPGQNEGDQIFKLCIALGSPTPVQWPEGYRLAASIGFHFPQCPPTPLSVQVPNICVEGIQLIQEMLSWNPQRRPSASACLQAPYFTNYMEEYRDNFQMSPAYYNESGQQNTPTETILPHEKLPENFNIHANYNVKSAPTLKDQTQYYQGSYIPRKRDLSNPQRNIFNYVPQQQPTGQQKNNPHLAPIASSGIYQDYGQITHGYSAKPYQGLVNQSNGKIHSPRMKNLYN